MSVNDVALSLQIEISLVAVDLHEGPGLGGGGSALPAVLGVRPVEVGRRPRLPEGRFQKYLLRKLVDFSINGWAGC